ncbi:MAG TPA: prolipoprotein diacylglyceryl transferase [Gemmatimonadaceae bacterium]|nr:prolipoprotein diacylglyceryl transferase [Gemmatimonadaceae bacterium]
MDLTGVVHHPWTIHLGPLEITGFGIAVLLAFAISQIIAQRELARRGHDPEPIADLLLAAILGTIVGGKIYYAILTGDAGTLLSRSGLVFWGGFIGAVIAVAAVIRWKKLSTFRIADVAGICIAAGYAVGRTGCWAVGDDYGRPWASRWAVSFPEGAPPSTAAIMNTEFGVPIPAGVSPNAVLSVHPTQLYETAMGIVMFLILWRKRDHEHAEGWLFGLYCVLAGVERFIVEIFRAKDDRFFGMFTMAQMISIAIFAVGVILMYMLRKPGPGRPGIYATART